MAEKSSELNETTEREIVSGTTDGEKFLQTINSNNNSLTDARENDTDVNEDEVNDETEMLREKIEETRRGMGETINAIQEKLSFSNISEQVKDQVSEQFGSAVESVKHAAFEKAGDLMQVVNKGIKEIKKVDVVKTAKKYPWLLSVIGVGIGALVVGSLTGKSKKRYRHEQDFNDDDYDDNIRYSDDYRHELTSGGESKKSTFQTTRNKIADTASSAYESVSDAAGTAYEGVSGAASSAYETVGGAAGKTYETVGNAAGYAYNKAGDLGGQVMKNYDYYIEENPLVVGAVALAIGAAVGFAIPLTKKENEYMGEYRDNIVEKAQASAQDAIGSVKQMAGDAQKAIVDEVKKQTA